VPRVKPRPHPPAGLVQLGLLLPIQLAAFLDRLVDVRCSASSRSPIIRCSRGTVPRMARMPRTTTGARAWRFDTFSPTPPSRRRFPGQPRDGGFFHALKLAQVRYPFHGQRGPPQVDVIELRRLQVFLQPLEQRVGGAILRNARLLLSPARVPRREDPTGVKTTLAADSFAASPMGAWFSAGASPEWRCRGMALARRRRQTRLSLPIGILKLKRSSMRFPRNKYLNVSKSFPGVCTGNLPSLSVQVNFIYDRLNT
jgi:hypothetical protein